MWVIWLFLFLQTVLARIITTDEIYKNLGNASFSDTYYITEKGSLQFIGMESLSMSGKFTNYGTFWVTSEESTEQLVINMRDRENVFLNGGVFEIQAGYDVESHILIEYEEFTNTGFIALNRKETSRDTSFTILGHHKWVNEGTIVTYNPGVKQAQYEMGPFDMTNNGMVELFNSHYRQATGQIFGDGCVFLEISSVVELNALYPATDQTFVMGEDATILIKGADNSNFYRVMNFSNGKRIGIEGSVIDMKYIHRDGLLILKSSVSIQNFIIGYDYNSELFRVTLDGYVTYDGEMPGYMDGHCKDFPFDYIWPSSSEGEIPETTTELEEVTSETADFDTSTTEEEVDTSTQFEWETSETSTEASSASEESLEQESTSITETPSSQITEDETVSSGDTTEVKSNSATYSDDDEPETWVTVVTSTITTVCTSYTTETINKDGKTKTHVVIITTNTKGVWYTKTVTVDCSESVKSSQITLAPKNSDGNTMLSVSKTSKQEAAPHTRPTPLLSIQQLSDEYPNKANSIIFRIPLFILAVFVVALGI
ncbi:uncharacterized protein SPAPADRAFT_64774 [Spathaspora passalidarum NRRL Y-27907]|uniref:Hyphally-regulated cell wall protein N-terminal domain-containing protein n=1 Tax=Spathaspora passalidarum (strain NRRL Y-27907 / 11-Y1) TaxID=619300 RepID=G3AER0_SPAPN|nr:uncharacterized protein SPAPADRAFT_64774 [Spathaspora passalidarum NRRL Y-27907]EGW35686.1 hypothetical protein SPAPADRAFT_64774 [Spathaspora passalidarum NRRL Y-27907]